MAACRRSLRACAGLALNKMNYLHIHLSDVTSFPVASEMFPELAAKGPPVDHRSRGSQSRHYYSSLGLGTRVP